MSLMLLGILNSQAAGGGGGAFDLLETTLIPTSTTASINFTSLDTYSGYRHLQLRMTLRPRRIGFNYAGMYFRFNSDSTSSYAFHNLYAEGTGSVFSNATTSSSAITPKFRAAGSTGAANVFTPMIVDILDFSSTSKNTILRAMNGFNDSTLANIALSSGLYNKTDAITQINIFGDEGWQAGTRVSLYGVK